MGSQIAAHVANAGVPALLLDVTADAAAKGLQRARGLKPDPFFTPDTWKLISTGSLDADLSRLREADWIVEAVVERLEIKRVLLASVDAARRPGSIVSSNTSGIPIAALAEGRSDDFRRHWLGTHFFNPPRYLHLLEVIPTDETDAGVTGRITEFADRHLGKGVVIAKDSPGFIGNHLGLHGIGAILAKVAAGEVTIEEVDEITGPVIGRPRSATFRTLDLAGLDILAHVMRDLGERLPDERARKAFALPPFVEQMLAKGWTGEKAGQGFYKRVTNASGGSDILTLDPATLEYRPRIAPRLPSVEAARNGATAARIRTLFQATDRAGVFLRDTLAPTLVYAARVSSDIAHHADDVDRVMRWGFGWELGPFETIDAIGIDRVVSVARERDPGSLEHGLPSLLQTRLDEGANAIRTAPLPPAGPGLEILRSASEASRVVKSNPGASLVDLGEGVLCVEFHSKMNTIGGDTIEMLEAGVREASRNFRALVVGNEAPHFSAGANLMLVLLEAREENWEEIDLMVRAFQRANLSLRYADVPVVVAPSGMTLGGGCEIVLHGDRVQAAADTFMGLVEVSVGLIPAAGGTKEMAARAAAQTTPGGDLLPAVQRAFETIGFAKVSASGLDARRLGYLGASDSVTMNRDRLIADAKARALLLAEQGYQPPVPPSAIPVGGDAVLAPLKLGIHLAWRAGRISDHDAVIGRKLAAILAGGALPHPTTVSEQRLLELEREAFLSLVAEPRTQDRMQHTLKTGKPLRN
jgi:3-hydroxyacyl-CoA dehydrogenase